MTHQQFLCKYLWPELSSSYYKCNNCDNCQRRNEENPQLTNAFSEILEISNTDKIRKNKYNELTLQRNVREVKLYEEKPPTILVPKKIARIALNDLVCKNLVKQEIWLQKSKIIQYSSCNIVVIGISETPKNMQKTNVGNIGCTHEKEKSELK
ncbi:12152_t:CDS:2 [Gigaspora rosea]|nr:12152_t:CDS:2 [Gigaspora rosea]